MIPKVILHTEVSVDGRMDWMADDHFLYYRMIADWKVDAMISGSSTMLAAYTEPDTPDLLAAPPPEKAPGMQRLLVVDSRGRLRCWRQMQQSEWWGEVTLLCSRATPKEYVASVKALGVDIIVAGEDQVDLRAALEEVHARYGIAVIRTDTGGSLHGALLRAGLVSEVSVVLNPCLVGGVSPRSMFVAPDLDGKDGLIPLRLLDVKAIEGDFVALRYAVVKEAAA
ncbi:MAG TPA: dihydrofolate reductase family protein [Anaerolineae bacterium]|nr:dihydrofolate reductase family protein [Anaerolineae bacterium]